MSCVSTRARAAQHALTVARQCVRRRTDGPQRQAVMRGRASWVRTVVVCNHNHSTGAACLEERGKSDAGHGVVLGGSGGQAASSPRLCSSSSTAALRLQLSTRASSSSQRLRCTFGSAQSSACQGRSHVSSRGCTSHARDAACLEALRVLLGGVQRQACKQRCLKQRQQTTQPQRCR